MFDLDIYKNRYKFGGDIDKAIEFVGGNGDFESINQFEFLKSVGLKPENKFLDLGCGCLRGTAKVVDYLNEGNFYGADVSDGLISLIPKRLESLAVVKTPNIFVINNFDFEEKLKTKFDVILSVSLLTHLLLDAIPYLFNGISKILKDDGSYYFTIYPVLDEKNIFEGGIDLARHNKDYLKQIANEYGLKVEDIPGDYANPIQSNKLIERVNTPYIAQWVMKAEKI